MGKLRITLFGPTRVERDGAHWDAAALGGVKQRQILELLATNLGTPVPKERLAERLWDGNPPSSYVATLESYVCVLRRRLGLGRGSLSALATTNKSYVLDPGQVTVDLVEVRSALECGAPADAEWADEERAKFSQLLATVCTTAARLALQGGYTQPALRLARTAVQQSYFSESARRELMRALWLSGERTQALVAYAELRARMLEELGVEPGTASQELYVEILKGSHTPEQDKLEVTTLLRLLQQALESSGRPDGPAEPGLVEVGRMLLARATSTQAAVGDAATALAG
jgi:DNA-binding SARP family transcriptional activator